MFFSERIKGILPQDRVLEIGPGAHPYHRSDVLLEKQFDDEKEYARQFGNNEKLHTDKELIFYSGDRFPFEDKSFDYVICSHVLEHVIDLPQFLSEVFRVSNRGYFEFPMIYYDYLYNIDAHVNFLHFNHGKLYYAIKTETPIYSFAPVQKFFYPQLNLGYTDTLNDLLPYFIQGFEWDVPFDIEKTTSIEALCHTQIDLQRKKIQAPEYSVIQLLKMLVRRILK